jgi:tryptophanyl-tRNA synthetase
MAQAKKILLSGVKPTGRPHIGNYFGAMKQFVDLQKDFDAFVFIADFHALTKPSTKQELAQNTLDLAIDYLAIGLNPKNVVLFKQSDVPQVTELTWIFNCLTTVPYLERAHAFKDAQTKNHEVNVGLFDYPILMASDILMYNSDIVPVGQDQKQHLEIARDTAEKFNRTFGDTFKLPEPLILETTKIVPGIDSQKMSKSYGNTIPLFATDDEIRKAVMSIVTGSGTDTPVHVRAIHELVRDSSYLDKLYEEKKGKYKDLKEALALDLIAFITPLRTRREEIAKNPKKVIKMLEKNAKKARKIAENKMKEVKEKVGLSFIK